MPTDLHALSDVLVPSVSGAAFTVTASNDAQNHFNFTIDATGTDTAHIHKSTPVELIVGFNFVINNNSPAQTIKAGQTASYNLDAVPLGNGSVFPGNVTLSCSTATLPPLTTCSFTPSLVASGQGDTNLVLKLQTTAATSAVAKLAGPHALWYDLGLSLAGVVALGGLKKSRRDERKKCACALQFLACCSPCWWPAAEAAVGRAEEGGSVAAAQVILEPLPETTPSPSMPHWARLPAAWTWP